MPAAIARQHGGGFKTVHKLQCTTFISANKLSPQLSKRFSQQGQTAANAALCLAFAHSSNPESPAEMLFFCHCDLLELVATA